MKNEMKCCVVAHFSPFNCCIDVMLKLAKGAYLENSHVVFCCNNKPSFYPVTCLDLVLER